MRRQVKDDYPRAFPEVVLNVRDKRILEIGENDPKIKMRFNVKGMSKEKVYVSRVDGNHRLHYAKGDDRREPLLAEVPFQIHIGLTRSRSGPFSWTLTATRRASTRRTFRSCKAGLQTKNERFEITRLDGLLVSLQKTMGLRGTVRFTWVVPRREPARKVSLG